MLDNDLIVVAFDLTEKSSVQQLVIGRDATVILPLVDRNDHYVNSNRVSCL
jgi:hypothetical protein